MGVKCPACGFDSPDGAQWCDFCKEPFSKKPSAPARPPAAAPPPAAEVPAAPAGPAAQPPTVPVPAAAPAALKALTKEQLAQIPPEQLLKSEAAPPAVPPWLRPLAWLFLVACFALSAMALAMLHSHYKEKAERMGPGAPGSP